MAQELSEEMLALHSAQEEYYFKEVTRKMRLDFWLKVFFAHVTTTIRFSKKEYPLKIFLF